MAEGRSLKGLNVNTRMARDIHKVSETVTVDSGRRTSNGSVITCTKRRVAYRHTKHGD